MFIDRFAIMLYNISTIFAEKTMKKNEKVIIKITDLNSDGAGVGRIDGVVVFVPYALPDETVEALIIKVAKNYCVGKLLRGIEKSES